jgi:hypothetical protein
MSEDYPAASPELVEQWWEEADQHVDCDDPETYFDYVAIQAAIRWCADQQKIRSGFESPLVERVADAIAEQATSAGIVNDRPARAAILQVAMWLREQGTPASGWAMRLEHEASND